MTDKMREEFKEWARSRGMSLPVNDGIHYNEWTQLAWESWQASRESLVIELPKDFTSGGTPNMRMLVAHHREIVGLLVQSIEAAGVKVKP